MTKATPKANLIWGLIIVMTMLFVFSGCTNFRSKKAPSTGPTGSTASAQSKNVYLDFGDVMLPRQLKVDRKNSFVFTTAGFSAGVLSLTGRVEVNSLISYFENKMPTDGWQLISAIKASRSMLLYKKQTRWCVISIVEGQFSTRAEVWVAPTMEGAPPTGTAPRRGLEESGLLKP